MVRYLHMVWRIPLALLGTPLMVVLALVMMAGLFCLGFAEGLLGLGDFCLMACAETPREVSEQIGDMWRWAVGAELLYS